MSANRKAQYLGPSASRMQAKMYKFLKEAKAELDPTNYETLVEILAKYHTGTIFLSTSLVTTPDYSETLSQLDDILQSSQKLTQSVNSMFPEKHHIGKVMSVLSQE